MPNRFPFPVPYGWFHVGFERDIAVGTIQSCRFFSQDLVLWRNEAGDIILQDAYCPHLGGNFGVDGKVNGNNIVCPFHHWEFASDGKVAHIPYAKKLNEKACVRVYPTRVLHGLILAWYHPEGIAPSYQIDPVDEFNSDEFVPMISTRHEVASCMQELAENTADSAHFQSVHQHPGPASYDSFTTEGADMVMKSRQTFPSSGGPVEGRLASHSQGFGWSVVRYQTLVEVCMVATAVPIDEEHVVQTFNVSWRNPERDPKIDRIGQAFNKEVNRQFTDDIRVWESKRYEPNPVLCDGDGPIHKVRKWAQQFYVNDENRIA